MRNVPEGNHRSRLSVELRMDPLSTASDAPTRDPRVEHQLHLNPAAMSPGLFFGGSRSSSTRLIFRRQRREFAPRRVEKLADDAALNRVAFAPQRELKAFDVPLENETPHGQAAPADIRCPDNIAIWPRFRVGDCRECVLRLGLFQHRLGGPATRRRRYPWRLTGDRTTNNRAATLLPPDE